MIQVILVLSRDSLLTLSTHPFTLSHHHPPHNMGLHFLWYSAPSPSHPITQLTLVHSLKTHHSPDIEHQRLRPPARLDREILHRQGRRRPAEGAARHAVDQFVPGGSPTLTLSIHYSRSPPHTHSPLTHLSLPGVSRGRIGYCLETVPNRVNRTTSGAGRVCRRSAID